FWTDAGLNSSQRRKRNIFAVLVAHIKLPNVFGFGSILALCFYVHLPLPPKAVEIVDEIPAHKSLDRAVYVVQWHALLQNFVAIHFDKLLRHIRQKSSVQTCNFRTLSRGIKKSLQIFRKELNVAAGTILQHERKAPSGSDARYGGRRKA